MQEQEEVVCVCVRGVAFGSCARGALPVFRVTTFCFVRWWYLSGGQPGRGLCGGASVRDDTTAIVQTRQGISLRPDLLRFRAACLRCKYKVDGSRPCD